jgi:hypothetical protein
MFLLLTLLLLLEPLLWMSLIHLAVAVISAVAGDLTVAGDPSIVGNLLTLRF